VPAAGLVAGQPRRQFDDPRGQRNSVLLDQHDLVVLGDRRDDHRPLGVPPFHPFPAIFDHESQELALGQYAAVLRH